MVSFLNSLGKEEVSSSVLGVFKMDGGIRLGKIFGIEISLDYSWFLIFVLITFVFSFSLFPQLIPGFGIGTYILVGLITSFFFFASVLFHELMHSFVAIRNGIQVAGIRLLLFGGVSQLSGEPDTPGVEFRMALAGPLSSLALGVVFLGLSRLGSGLGFPRTTIAPAFYLGFINIILGVFNLLPGFPMDGGRVLRSIIWYFTGNLRRSTSIAAIFGQAIAYIMIFVGIAGPLFLNDLSLIWFVLLGWYLLRAAQAEYQQVLYHEALEGVPVSEIMTPNPETVSPNMSVQDLVQQHFLKHNWVAYPVVENGNVKGMVTLKGIQNLPRSEWSTTPVSAIMRPISSDIVTRPDAQILDILTRLVTKAEGRMLVMQDDRLVGIVTETDVTRTLIRKLHLEDQLGRPAA